MTDPELNRFHRIAKWSSIVRVLLVLALLLAAAGCGGPKADVSIFIMPPDGMGQEITNKLETDLQSRLGPSPTVSVMSSPIYSLEKMMVEVAAGDHGIIVLDKTNFTNLAKQGGMISLDGLYNPADYPGGVVEVPVDGDKNGATEKHLYGLPVNNSKWLKDAGYKGPELYAFIHPKAPHMEQAKQVFQKLVEQ